MRRNLVLTGLAVLAVVLVFILARPAEKEVVARPDLDRLAAEMQQVAQEVRGEIAGVRILAIVLFVVGLLLGVVATVFLLHRIKFLALKKAETVAALPGAHKLVAEARAGPRKKAARGLKDKTDH